ncbi:NACHT domain-containing protein [Nocardia sp. NPDC055049]
MDESGHEFEMRGLALARSIHDPRGEQGSVMHGGREHDALFVTEEAIHAYEFTVDRKKQKAQKDASKIRNILLAVLNRPENRYKSLTGWFVTRDEPTADQRSVVEEEARRGNVRIHAISIAALSNRLCNSTEYLKLRGNGPFGSISYSVEAQRSGNSNHRNIKVDAILTDKDGALTDIPTLADRVVNGYRALIVGEFGVGKSHALRELYWNLRKRHFETSSRSPFPAYINLRDCVGLRSETEVLRRHAEEIGFDPDSLIRAWRAGACVLLLDGFDEISPSRWLGGPVDLKDVRYAALEPVRRLIEATPDGVGIVVCGRTHYFSSEAEMTSALGLPLQNVVDLRNFTDEQVGAYLHQAGVTWAVPEWLPARPLLIGYLVAFDSFADLDVTIQIDQASAWRRFFDSICKREARMFTAVRPETIKMIMTRVATLARSKGYITGPIDMDTMRQAFIDINKRQPDGEGIQLLLRLPGLAISDAGDDTRVFVDRNLADAAYGEDLADYLANPYDKQHPLVSVASWIESATDLGVEVAAATLDDRGMNAKSVLKAAAHRQNQRQFDAVLADSIRVASALGSNDASKHQHFIVDGVEFSELNLSVDSNIFASVTFLNCVFHYLDISLTEMGRPFPEFSNCIIGYLDGVSSIPDWLASSFKNCSIEEYSQQSHTTAGIMQLGLNTQDKVALTILKKIYNQRGSGRKESALSRGLDQASREHVPGVLSALQSLNLIQKSSAGSNILYLPVKGKRADAMRALEKPGEFRLEER